MNRRGFLRFLGLAPMGVAAAAAMPTVPQPARGGLVISDKPYLVGERCGESFIPKRVYNEIIVRHPVLSVRSSNGAVIVTSR